MHATPPLFKYLTPDRVTVLQNELIRFTQPADFNDPFEMPIFIERLAEKSLPSPDEMFTTLIRSEYAKNTDVSSKIPFSLYLAFCESKRSEFLSKLPDLERDIMPILRAKLRDEFQRVCVLCVSETPSSLLMWAHYAEAHKGFVVEIDPSAPVFNQRKSPEDDLRHLRKVSYRPDRPIMNLDEIDTTSLILTKSQEWEYEGEWRMLVAAEHASTKIPASPYDICLFPFPQTCIRRIILGARATDTTETAIRQAITNSEIRLQRAALSEREFALEFRDI